MNDNLTYQFTLEELTKALIQYKGLSEGKWMLAVQFGISAVNLGKDDENMSPAAVVPLISVGLNPVDDDRKNNLIVDAAELNK